MPAHFMVSHHVIKKKCGCNGYHGESPVALRNTTFCIL